MKLVLLVDGTPEGVCTIPDQEAIDLSGNFYKVVGGKWTLISSLGETGPGGDGGGTPGGADTEVQFNNRGAFGGSQKFIFITIPGQEELTLDFTGDLGGSSFNAVAEAVAIDAGPNSRMTVDLGASTAKAILIANDEPGGAGTLIKDTGGGGLQIQSDVEVDISSATATPITIAIGNATDLLAFFGAGGVAKPTVSGAKAGNTALASLITALASLGLLIDGTDLG